MNIELNRRELALIASLLQARVNALNPSLRHARPKNHATLPIREEFEALLHVKERVDFALLETERSNDLPSNILYSDSYHPGENGWTPGHRHDPRPESPSPTTH